MKLCSLVLVLLLTQSCATRQITYDRIKILQKYSPDYVMFVDDEKVDLEFLYLDKDNVKQVNINKRTQELKITQFKKTKLFKLINLSLDSLAYKSMDVVKKEVDLILIDGLLLTDSLVKKTKVDPNAIQSFTVISQKKMVEMITCRAYNGDIIFITTK